jgi:hypothetical protein
LLFVDKKSSCIIPFFSIFVKIFLRRIEIAVAQSAVDAVMRNQPAIHRPDVNLREFEMVVH